MSNLFSNCLSPAASSITDKKWFTLYMVTRIIQKLPVKGLPTIGKRAEACNHLLITKGAKRGKVWDDGLTLNIW